MTYIVITYHEADVQEEEIYGPFDSHSEALKFATKTVEENYNNYWDDQWSFDTGDNGAYIYWEEDNDREDRWYMEVIKLIDPNAEKETEQ